MPKTKTSEPESPDIVALAAVMEALPKFVTPKLGSNTTPEMLVDYLGQIRENKKVLDKYEGFFKEALKGRWPGGSAAISGDNFVASKKTSIQERISSELVRAKLSPEELPEVIKEIEVTTISTDRKE